MAAPHVVVSGASIAGLAAASWLARSGWAVTVLERAPAFRNGGQNVDVRGVAREVVERMGLLEAVRERNTTETGTVVVDGDGGVVAELPSDGPDGATAELEILRGDLARILLDRLPAEVEVRYGDPIARVEDGADRVSVSTESGWSIDADLLVVAEGVRSSTRELVFGAASSGGELHELGITMAFGTIPRTDDDDDRWRWFFAPGRRQVHLRPDNHGTTRAILAYAGGPPLAGSDPSEAMRVLRSRFVGAGWQTQRVLDGFGRSEDVYVDDLAQVRLPTWHRGRVVLLGDAAWCVTPIGGGGTSLALTGAYVLTASLAARGTAERTDADGDDGAGDLEAALTAYETWMRPMVDQVQSLPPGIDRIAYPRTRLGLLVRGAVLKAMTSPPLSRVMARHTQVADTDQELPPLSLAG